MILTLVVDQEEVFDKISFWAIISRYAVLHMFFFFRKHLGRSAKGSPERMAANIMSSSSSSSPPSSIIHHPSSMILYIGLVVLGKHFAENARVELPTCWKLPQCVTAAKSSKLEVAKVCNCRREARWELPKCVICRHRKCVPSN